MNKKLSDTDDLKNLLTRRKVAGKPDAGMGLSTGCTVLNLAMSGHYAYGVLPGHYVLFVGDSKSGKTFLALTMLAEASINPKYDNYRLIYDNGERGALMDLGRYFGRRMCERLEPASTVDGIAQHSTTVEEFYYNLDDALSNARPCIYVLDSMDSLDSEDDYGKFQEQKKAYRKGKEVTGTYGTSKAKANSTGIRRVIHKLTETGSVLVVISQTRENIGFGSTLSPKTRGGGKSLTFYASEEVWFSIRENLTKTVKGQTEKYGTVLAAHVRKNRQTGREPKVDVVFYPAVGVDDLGSCIRFLVERDHWKSPSKSKVSAPEFDHEGSIEGLIQSIQNEPKQVRKLRSIVSDVWQEIEEACKVDRRSRYE